MSAGQASIRALTPDRARAATKSPRVDSPDTYRQETLLEHAC
jgi:hypothetical protein